MAKDKVVHITDGGLSQRTTSDNIEDCTNAADAVAVNDAVYLNANNTVAKASASAGHKVFGFVFEIVDSTNCRVLTGGLLEDFDAMSTMTVNDDYFLAEAGALALNPAAYRQKVGFAFNGSDLFVRIEEGQKGTQGATRVTTAGSRTTTTANTWYPISATFAAMDLSQFTHEYGILTYTGSHPCWLLVTANLYGSTSTASVYNMGISVNTNDPDLYSTARLTATALSFMVQRAIYVQPNDALRVYCMRTVDGGNVVSNVGSWLSAVKLNP